MVRKRRPIKNPEAYKEWGSWQYLSLNGRMRRGIQFPVRERVSIRVALSRIGCRYKEIVPVFNSEWKGHNGRSIRGGVQWLDFTVFHPAHKRMGVILILPHNMSLRRMKDAMLAKEAYLKHRNIPYIIFGIHDTSQVYEIKIRMWFRKEELWR